MTSLSGTERTNALATEVATIEGARRTSAIAAATAAVMCLAIAAAGWLLAPEGWILGIAGLPATTFFAWQMGPGVATASREAAVARAFGLTLATILVSDALVVGAIIASVALGISNAGLGIETTDVVTTVVYVLGGGLVLYLYGAIIVGIPVSLIVAPAALIWAAIVRRLVRHRA